MVALDFIPNYLSAFSRNQKLFSSVLDKLETYALENFLNITPI
jgi:hypothetical protein